MSAPTAQPAQPSPPPPLGFEDESTPPPPPTAAKPQGPRRKSAAELKANFASVFGHGAGKASLIAAGLFIVIAGALGIRGLRNASRPPIETPSTDIPTAPAPRNTVEPIDQREAARRANFAAQEASAAAGAGVNFQPRFDPIVEPTKPSPTTGATQPTTPVVPRIQGSTSETEATPIEVAVTAGDSSAPATDKPRHTPGRSAGAPAQADEQRREAELARQRDARDKYVARIRADTLAAADDLLLGGPNKQGGIRAAGTYTTLNYLPSAAQAKSSTQPAPAATTQDGRTAPAIPAKAVIFKAGTKLFATLDAEVNTDDGGDVLATVRGGPYDGATLIGKIEQAPRNIRLRFATLATKPDDPRPTMTISAVAIRQEDARQGVAEQIDHHTLERYTALFAGSVLAGLGKAAAQPQGDTIVLPNGQVVVTQPEPTNRRIAMYALGEVGTSAGAEIRKSFTQPPTYSTPANTGIGVVFLADVTEK